MLNRDAPARIVLTTDTVGGVWRYCLEIAAGFTARGASVTLVAMGPPASDTQRAEVAALPNVALLQTRLPLDWLADSAADLAQASHALATIARQCSADSVQLHTPALAVANWPAQVVAVVHSCVATWWRALHGTAPLPADLAWRAACVARGLDAADAVIAPSQAFAAALRESYGAARDIHAIPNGRRMARLPRAPHPQVLAAGRLWDEGKNIVALDMAAGGLDAPVRAAGPVRGPNGACISVHNLHLLGPLNDAALAQEYAHAAVFVSPARYEPFGLAVLEAAQTGVALVLSDIPTFRQLWDGAALFVHPEDPTALAQTLRHLLADPDRCAALGESARARTRLYTAERMVAATWSIHCNLWRARGGTRPRYAA